MPGELKSRRDIGAELAPSSLQALGALQMAHCDETGGGYAVMLSPDDKYWCWSVYDVDGRPRATGRDTDREAAWRSGLFAAGAIGALERAGNRRF